MQLQQVPLEWAPKVWGQVSHFFVAAVTHAQGDYSLDHMQTMVCTGQWLLVVVTEAEQIHGAIVVSVFNRPAARVGFVHALGGKGIVTDNTIMQFKALVAALGATEIEGAVRESVARLVRRVGLREKYRIVGAAI